MKKLFCSLLAVVIAIVVAFPLLQTPDTNPQAMIAKYRVPSSAFVSVANGLRIHYTDRGCQSCPVLVFVHGANGSLHNFEPIARKLADRYRVISYDQPGHGLTGPHPNDDYSAEGYISALEELLQHTGINKFTIVGNSMGGWIAWRYALKHPSRLKALVLINASGAPLPTSAISRNPYLGARIMRNPIGRWLGSRFTPKYVVRRSLYYAISDKQIVTDELIDRYWELLRYPGNRRAAGIRIVTDRETDFAKRLNEIATPTLIMWGAEDRVSPKYDAETFYAMIPNSSKIIFPKVGHIPMEEAPELTADTLHRYLAINLGTTRSD